MQFDKKKDIYSCAANYQGLLIELISDSRQLIKLDFINEKKKIKAQDELPYPLKNALSYLSDYFNGKKPEIEIILNTKILNYNLVENTDKLFLDLSAYTEKEIMIYRELLKVEPGNTISYKELAERSGISRGARFAGNCMAGNRFPVIIPCHRVIKTDGSIGNYTGGAGIKELLLKHENHGN